MFAFQPTATSLKEVWDLSSSQSQFITAAVGFRLSVIRNRAKIGSVSCMVTIILAKTQLSVCVCVCVCVYACAPLTALLWAALLGLRRERRRGGGHRAGLLRERLDGLRAAAKQEDRTHSDVL